MKQHYRFGFPLPLVFVFLLLISGSISARSDLPVVVITPSLATMQQSLQLTGTFTAKTRSVLSSRVEGLVAEVFVDAGSMVSKGQPLLQLDAQLIDYELNEKKAAINKAMVDRDEADRQVKEAVRLRANKHISASELAMREANLALKKATVSEQLAAKKRIEERLNRHTLKAPFAGIISQKMTEAGQWVNRADGVFELVDLDNILLDIQVPQEHLAQFTDDVKVFVFPDSYPDHQLTGHINTIVPVSDQLSRSFLVRVSVEKLALTIAPGTSATAQFQFNSQNALTIPRDALLLHPDGGYSVFVIENNLAKRRQVSLGDETKQGVSVISGIEADDQVVIRGNEVLREDQTVKIVQP